MTREEITQKIRSKGYTAVFEAIPPQFPEDHIEDEDQTVKWNRQFVADKNKERLEIIQRNRNAQNACDEQFRKDLYEAVMEEFHLNEEQAGIAYSYAYSNSHAHYGDMVCSIFEICEIYAEMREKEQDKK